MTGTSPSATPEAPSPELLRSDRIIGGIFVSASQEMTATDLGRPMRVCRSLRFPLILGGALATIGGLLWPSVREARQSAQRRGSPETLARSGWQLPAITRNGVVIRRRMCSVPTASPGIAGEC